MASVGALIDACLGISNTRNSCARLPRCTSWGDTRDIKGDDGETVWLELGASRPRRAVRGRRQLLGVALWLATMMGLVMPNV